MGIGQFFEEIFSNNIESTEGRVSTQEVVSVEELDRTSSNSKEYVLENREAVSSEKLKEGVNEVFVVKLKNDGKGIFKPKSGECVLGREAKEGTYYKRERAAYLVDRFLGFDLVPPTVIRNLSSKCLRKSGRGGEVGSFQEFIPKTKSMVELDVSQIRDLMKEKEAELVKLAIFDYIIYNSDRNMSNYLLDRDNKIIAIDHGLSFANDYISFDLRLGGKKIISEVINKLSDFVNWKHGQEVLTGLLKELLSEEELSACMARIEKMAKVTQRGKITKEGAEELNYN